MVAKAKQTPVPNKHLSLSVVAVLVVIIGLALLTIVVYARHRSSELSTNPRTTSEKGEQSSNGSSSTSKTTVSTSSKGETSQPGDTKSGTGGSSTITNLLTPSGDFVSAHKVKVDTVLTSVCNTSPGASCTISFMSDDGTQKSLSSQTADRGGSTYWNSWTPQSIGLSVGTWKVLATATAGSQSKSANDANDLVVSP